jgi:hypothetical protein
MNVLSTDSGAKQINREPLEGLTGRAAGSKSTKASALKAHFGMKALSINELSLCPTRDSIYDVMVGERPVNHPK